MKRVGFGSQMIMIPPAHPLSATVPTTIADGERAHYVVEWPEYERLNGEKLRRHFAGRLGWIRARLFRVGVSTSAGGIFDARIERQLAARFLELAIRRPPR